MVWSLLLIALVCGSGCGSGQATVEGKVTFEGQPVEQGTIVFEPADGTGAVAGGKIENGKYRLGTEEQLTPGNKIVRILAMRTTGKKIPAGPPAADDVMIDEVQQYIPSHYNVQSTLTVQVAAGKGTHDFELPVK
jgi:hypothetical protein